MNISNIGQDLKNWVNPSVDTIIESKVIVAINFFIGFSVLVAVIVLIYSGYLFMTSAGDAEKIEKAQKGVTAAIVGMIIVFLAKVIIGFILDKVL